MNVELEQTRALARELNAWLNFNEALLVMACRDETAVRRATARIREGLIDVMRKATDQLEVGSNSPDTRAEHTANVSGLFQAGEPGSNPGARCPSRDWQFISTSAGRGAEGQGDDMSEHPILEAGAHTPTFFDIARYAAAATFALFLVIFIWAVIEAWLNKRRLARMRRATDLRRDGPKRAEFLP